MQLPHLDATQRTPNTELVVDHVFVTNHLICVSGDQKAENASVFWDFSLTQSLPQPGLLKLLCIVGLYRHLSGLDICPCGPGPLPWPLTLLLQLRSSLGLGSDLDSTAVPPADLQQTSSKVS